MSETEYSRLAAKLDTISEKVAVIDEKLTGYNQIREDVTRHDKAIELIDQRCKQVQEAKKEKSINWGAVWGSVIAVLIATIIAGALKLGGVI